MTKKILLAEDDSFTQYMMSEVFTALGYEFDIAKDGRECTTLLENAPGAYGIVLMDIHMPVLSGVEAAKAIRATDNDPPKNIPIIAVTADGEFYDDDVAKANGMDGFLRKPVIASEINSLVDRYLDKAS